MGALKSVGTIFIRGGWGGEGGSGRDGQNGSIRARGQFVFALFAAADDCGGGRFSVGAWVWDGRCVAGDAGAAEQDYPGRDDGSVAAWLSATDLAVMLGFAGCTVAGP